MAGKLFLILEFVEQRKTSFAVGRLVMMSGVNLRQATATSADDPMQLAKVMFALDGLLTRSELEELKHLLA